MPTVRLDDRALVAVTGPEAGHLLQNIVTTDLDALAAGEARPGALLTPQGKILFDFLISRSGEGLLLECRADVADDFVRRLALYKLRAKVEIAKREQAVVAVSWDDEPAASGVDSSASGGEAAASRNGSGWLRDRRFPDAAVLRNYDPAVTADRDAEAWHSLRIRHGVAESGADYALGDAFPHDVLLDELGGIGFQKGCYVGQEVVSRMQHRGTARRRVLIAAGDGRLPRPGTAVVAGGRALGSLGSVAGDKGLAILRVDRAKEAMDAGTAITAEGVAVGLAIPGFAKFTFPRETVGSEEA